MESYETAIDLDPKNATAYRNKGLALIELGRHAEAVESYETAIRLDPKDIAARSGKGAALKRLNDGSDD